MKSCCICKKVKDLSEFYLHKLVKDGRTPQCKDCSRLEKNRRTRANKAKLINVLGGKCSKCGYNKCQDALEFHHHSIKNFTISAKMNWSYNRLLQEAMNCELVCANCHREIHANLV